jgi:thiosulfate dehydrogenase (quinone) large subunit
MSVLWMVMLYTASAIWLENNPFVDDHVVYAIILAGVAYLGDRRYFGLGRRRERLAFVRLHPILR